MIKAGIVGGTGYTGIELLRLLSQHPQVELAAITSRQEAGTAVSALFPSLRGRVSLAFSQPDRAPLAKCDVVFFATPNGVAMREARARTDEVARRAQQLLTPIGARTPSGSPAHDSLTALTSLVESVVNRAG